MAGIDSAPLSEILPEIKSTRSRTGELVLPLREILQDQGVKFDINPHYQDVTGLPVEKSSVNRHTRFPIETDSYRKFLIGRLREAIKNGENFAFIFADADNVKAANDRTKEGRALGDLIILHGGHLVSECLDSSGLSPQVETRIAGQSTGADETLVLILGPSRDELIQLQNAINKVQIPVKTSSPKWTFSQSMTLVASTPLNMDSDSDPELQRLQQEVIQIRLAMHMNQPVDEEIKELYKNFKELADDKVHRVKAQKDLIDRAPEPNFLHDDRSLKESIQEMVDNIGGTRISSELLLLYLQAASAKAMEHIISLPPEQQTEFLSDYKQITTLESLQEFSNKWFS